LFVFDVDLELLLANASPYNKYSAVPKYPFVTRDLTVVKPVSVFSVNIINAVKALNIPFLIDIIPFDLYVDKNNITEHSITYRFIFRDKDKTLTDEEVNHCMKSIMECITTKFSVRLKI